MSTKGKERMSSAAKGKQTFSSAGKDDFSSESSNKGKEKIATAGEYEFWAESGKHMRERAIQKEEEGFWSEKSDKSKPTTSKENRPKFLTKATRARLLDEKTREIGYVLQQLLCAKKQVERMTASLHMTDLPRVNKHTYFAENREEAREIRKMLRKKKKSDTTSGDNIPESIKRETEKAYRELEETKARVKELEEQFDDLNQKKELLKRGHRRKLHKDELVNPTNKPVYRWRAERKR